MMKKKAKKNTKKEANMKEMNLKKVNTKINLVMTAIPYVTNNESKILLRIL